MLRSHTGFFRVAIERTRVTVGELSSAGALGVELCRASVQRLGQTQPNVEKRQQHPVAACFRTKPQLGRLATITRVRGEPTFSRCFLYVNNQGSVAKRDHHEGTKIRNNTTSL